MDGPLILISQNATALVPFPCPVSIQKHGEDDDREFWVVCDEHIMAKYKAMAPAKMEVSRLAQTWRDRAATKACDFTFVKDVK